jgi:hypothetical protein
MQKKLEFNSVNLQKNAAHYTRQELTVLFKVSLSMIDRKLKDLNLKAKRAAAGRPSIFKE